jgi:hypothetical protein
MAIKKANKPSDKKVFTLDDARIIHLSGQLLERNKQAYKELAKK